MDTIFRERQLPDKPKTGRTWVIVILAIILIVIIIGISLWLFFRPRESTGTIIDTVCSSAADCGPGQICVNNICRSLECITPPPPTSINITTPVTGVISVTWNPVATASSYTVYLGTNPNFNRFNALDVELSEDTTVQFSNLVSGFNYYIFITSLNECGEGEKSQTLSIFVTYIWPDKFVINGRSPQRPEYGLGALGDEDSGDKRLKLDLECKNAACPCSYLCNYQYDSNNLQIQRFGDPTTCLVEDSGAAKMDLCSNYSDAQKQWVYLEQKDRLCLVNDTDICLTLTYGGIINADDSITGTYYKGRWRPVSVL